MNSIIQSGKFCIITGTTQGLHKHHCLNGNGLRSFAEKEGLWVYLSGQLHRTLHDTNYRAIELKRIAQYVYELSHTRKQWMDNVHKNYLSEPITDNELKRYGLYHTKHLS